MKFDQRLTKYAQKCIEKNIAMFLIGEPGVGKSSWGISLAESMHTKIFVLPVNQMADKADITGARLVPITEKTVNPDGSQTEIITGYQQKFYPHETIMQAILYAQEHPRETPILMLDEINRSTSDVTSACLSLTTMRAIGSIELPPNLRIINTGNDKGNITSLDEASISRMAMFYVLPDLDTFIAHNKELNPFVEKTLRAHPECLLCKQVSRAGVDDDSDNDDSGSAGEMSIEELIDQGNDMTQITTPRTITAVSNFLNTFTNEELADDIADTYLRDGEEISVLQEALEAMIGRTEFTAYLMAEIASGLATTNNQSQVIAVPKPAVYDSLKSCGSVTDIQNMIGTMSDNDKSGCIVYALYEQEDNRAFLTALSTSVDNLTPDDMRQLVRLIADDRLDHENVNAFLATGSALATSLSFVLSSM